MAAPSASVREKSKRLARIYNRNKSENDEDAIHIDSNRGYDQNIYDILSVVVEKQGISDLKKLSYINAFIKIIQEIYRVGATLNLSRRDIICCIRVLLVSNNATIRAAAFRALRHFLNDPDDVAVLNKLQISHLIARSIDIVWKNDHERIQALRLSLKILKINPKQFPLAICRSIVSLTNSINESKDRMIVSCLSTLCQLCVLNPDLLLDSCGETCLLKCSVEIASSRINECIIGCLLFLLNKPHTRRKANLKLDYITGVFCDLQRKKINLQDGAVNYLMCSRLSFLAALRSWSGVLFLCSPANASGIKAIINILYLNNAPELKKEILEFFFDVMDLNFEKSFAPSVIDSIDPGKRQDSWKLTEGFIVSEGKDLLPHKAETRPNLTEVHSTLLLYTFLECGIISALVEVVCSDESLNTQAIILLGFLLYLSHKLLPNELLEVSPALPTLIHYVTNGQPHQKTHAIVAVSLLHRIHRIFSQPLYISSLFLRKLCSQGFVNEHRPKIDVKNIDIHIKEAEIFYHRDPRHWNWIHVRAVLKCRSDAFLKLEDAQHRTALRKIVHFYKPSSSQFGVIQCSIKDKATEIYVTTGFLLLDLLLDCQQEEAQLLFDDFLSDLMQQLENVIAGRNIHECWTPYVISSYLSQYYFLLLGHMTSTLKGLETLEKLKVLDTLSRLLESTNHDIYIKLIISSLNYSKSSATRKILSKALTSPITNVRVYATEFLLVLARANLPMFHKWGLELLIGQLYDNNKLVANVASDALHELCYDSVYLDAVIELRPSLLHLGDRGHLLLIRFLGTPTGFHFLDDTNFIHKELETWEKGYNYRYVGLVESMLHDALTLHQRTETGRFSRRLTNAKHRFKNAFIPPHLYGELSRHEAGMKMLQVQPAVHKMVQIVAMGFCDTDAEILQLKSSLWGLCNMGVSSLGLQFLQQHNVIQYVVELSQSCPVLAIRATAYYCISMVATLEAGANILDNYDWIATRRKRSETWPVEKTEHFLIRQEHATSFVDDKDSSSAPSVYEMDLSDYELFYVSQSRSSTKGRATTLPPGFSYNLDFLRDDRDLMSSPPSSFKRGHQRSYSETSSLTTKRLSTGGRQRLSFQDAAGLQTLQNLQSSRRPDPPAAIFSELETSNKTRLSTDLDRLSTPVAEFETAGSSLLYAMSSSTTSNSSFSIEVECEVQGPAYMGICLPRALVQYLSLSGGGDEEKKEERRRRRPSVSFCEMELVQELAEENSPLGSSTSSENEAEGGGDRKREHVIKRLRHDASQCIACCTKVPKPKRLRKISTSSLRRRRTDTESSYTNAPSTSSSPQMAWRMRPTSEGGSADEDEEENEHTEAVLPPPPGVLSHTRVRRDIIKHCSRMCNPVWAKGSSRGALLGLKQSHQSVFQDVCLYSSVCNILCSSSCRMTARSFIQELFLDLTFVQLYEEAAKILKECAPSVIVAPSQIKSNSQQEVETTEKSPPKCPDNIL